MIKMNTNSISAKDKAFMSFLLLMATVLSLSSKFIGVKNGWIIGLTALVIILLVYE